MAGDSNELEDNSLKGWLKGWAQLGCWNGLASLFFSMQFQNFFTIPFHGVSPAGKVDFLGGGSELLKEQKQKLFCFFKVLGLELPQQHSSVFSVKGSKCQLCSIWEHKDLNMKRWSLLVAILGNNYPCSPSVSSRLVVETVDGDVAHDNIFSGLLFAYINLPYTLTFFLSVFNWVRKVSFHGLFVSLLIWSLDDFNNLFNWHRYRL